MDKNAIKKYAVWARTELIERVTQKAQQYEISADADPKADAVHGKLLSKDEKDQRAKLISKVKEKGYDQIMEEVAYTWFNRFSALRFMEVNNYLPSRVRVFTDANGAFKPQILTEAIHMELKGLNMEKVYALKEANDDEDLFKYLIITQCNALSEVLPGMFQKIADYTELLFPDNLLRDGSVLEKMVAQGQPDSIPECDWKDQIQIIGWLYQYYNTEPKDKVFADLKKNIKITKENIPAATQLFTPDWIVRYMVENSLGRLWLENHPNDTLKANWTYYLDEAEQTPEVAEKLRVLRSQSPVKSPEDIRLIDPCMGSGHILVYAFDVLMQIYESEGYNPRDAAKLILEKNIYGLDIDRRAYQLAYFSLMMKARQYNRRIFTEGIEPQVYHPAGFHDGEEYGSLVKVDMLPPKPVEKTGQLSLEDTAYDVQLNAWNFKRLLAQKYDVVVTNPPYMGNKGLNGKISEYLQTSYADYKSDTFSAFIVRCGEMAKLSGYVGMFSPYVWMFIQSYEKLRNNLYSTKNITTLIQFEYSAFEEATVPVCSFVYQNRRTGEKGGYFRLVDYRGGMEVQRQKYLEAIANPQCGYFYTATADNFVKIPSSPVAYWVNSQLINIFESSKLLESFGASKVGLQTGDTNRFLRLWFEVKNKSIYFSVDENRLDYKWFPICKGGEFRKWYGNNEYIVNWQNDGFELRNFKDAEGKLRSRPQNIEYYFKRGITWNLISSANFAVRCYQSGFIFDVSANAFFCADSEYEYFAGLLNSKVILSISKILNPTMNFSAGVVANLPIVYETEKHNVVSQIVKHNISLSHIDWDSFETSWDFKRHPLISGEHTVAEAFDKWEREAAERFDALKANEEELNRIFIDIYGLQDELTPEVEDKDVTAYYIADTKEDAPESLQKSNYLLTKKDVIKSLISYAVGCMFGRYSLDVEGLAYAGGDWDASKYATFPADRDNIIPICDDEYFDDDIVNRFVKFVEVVYGKDSLEENLTFISDALGGRGAPREVIRNYFNNDFFKDHCKTYQKRPIYWLFDSGTGKKKKDQKNGFKCLIYMHRYQPNTIARIRTDYVHEQQARYRTAIEGLERQLTDASASERVKINKQLTKLKDQAEETRIFEEKIHHLADQMIKIDLDDGVKHNYAIFQDVLAKIK